MAIEPPVADVETPVEDELVNVITTARESVQEIIDGLSPEQQTKANAWFDYIIEKAKFRVTLLIGKEAETNLTNNLNNATHYLRQFAINKNINLYNQFIKYIRTAYLIISQWPMLESDAQQDSEKINQLRKKLEADVKSIEQMKCDAKKAVSWLGRTAINSGYNSSARWAGGFTIAAIAALLLVMGAAIWYGIDLMRDLSKIQDFKYLEVFAFAARILFIFVFGVPIWYLKNLSNKLFKVYRMNRQKQLELSSIEAYLASLPQQEREQVIIALAPKYFGCYKDDDLNELQQGDGFLAFFKQLVRPEVTAG